MKNTGVTARGIKLPIIKQGDNLVEIVASSILDAAKAEKIVLNDKDIVAVTESLLARAQGNFVNVADITSEVNEKFKDTDTIGIVFPITSRNRFSAILKAFVQTGKKIVVQLSYPSDEIGNRLITLDDIEAKNVNPFSDILDEKKFRKLFGYPVHEATGVDYIDYYGKICGKNGKIILANNAKAILKYTKYVICADVHTRFRTKKVLLENGAKTVICLDQLANKSTNGRGYNEKYGLLGSNLSTDAVLKLFPRDCENFVEALQAELKKQTGKTLEAMLYGDGAYKDPVCGVWELYDPVVSPAFTKGLAGSPNEIKLKYIADNLTNGKSKEEAREIVEKAIKEKEKNLVGKSESLGTTPRQYSDLLGSLADLVSGSGDRGTPVVLIQNYFSNYTN